MPITHVRTIDTPWSPYAVTFSRDGSRLAMGGGSWYGHGGIILLDIERDRTRWLDWMDVPAVAEKLMRPPDLAHTTSPTKVPTISCLCFSDDDRYLAASMWSSRWHYAPTMLFEVDGLAVSPRETFTCSGRSTINVDGQTLSDIQDATPTGVLLRQGHIITRQHRRTSEVLHVLVVDQLPASVDIPVADRFQHLTHHRLVVVRNTAITEGKGGLALRDLRIPAAPLTIVPVHDCPRVTAIAALPGNGGFVTGGSSGQIDKWSWDGEWRQQRLRAAVTSKNARAGHPSSTALGGHLPEQIVAIVTLADSHDLVAVSAEGELLLLRSSGEWESTSIPLRGSPRSLAAHPHQPRVAVGMKQGGCGKPASVVGLFDVR